MQTYKLNNSATGARCVHEAARNRLLIAGIVLAGVLSVSLLLSAIMFYRYHWHCCTAVSLSLLLNNISQLVNNTSQLLKNTSQ